MNCSGVICRSIRFILALAVSILTESLPVSPMTTTTVFSVSISIPHAISIVIVLNLENFAAVHPKELVAYLVIGAPLKNKQLLSQ